MSADEIEALIQRYEYLSDQQAFSDLLSEVNRLLELNCIAEAEALAQQLTIRTGIYVRVAVPPADYRIIH